jgi:hypothetical protein
MSAPGRGEAANASAILSEEFVESLLAAPDEAAMRDLVRQRAALVEQAYRWKCDANATTLEDNSRGSPRRDREFWRDSPTWDRPISREQTLIESHADDSLESFVKAIHA